MLFRVFFSERVLGALGRDPSFFRYVEGSVADHLLGRVRHALAELDPSANPYATWILTGTHGDALPHALRAENFDTIRANLDRLEWHRGSIESLLDEGIIATLDRANLSDIFEYMSPENASALFQRLAESARPGARLAYWNMMVPRRASELLSRRSLREQRLLDCVLRRDSGVVVAGLEQHVVALHPLQPNDRVAERELERVTEVQLARDVRRRVRVDERLPRGVGLGVVEAFGLPRALPAFLDAVWRIERLHLHQEPIVARGLCL